MDRKLFSQKLAFKNIFKGSGFVFFSTALFGLLIITAMMNAWYASFSLVTPLEKVLKQTLSNSC